VLPPGIRPAATRKNSFQVFGEKVGSQPHFFTKHQKTCEQPQAARLEDATFEKMS
jgi:hypothetical protein